MCMKLGLVFPFITHGLLSHQDGNHLAVPSLKGGGSVLLGHRAAFGLLSSEDFPLLLLTA